MKPSAQGESGLIRVAFAGRTSTYDQQDPTLSIPRQLRTCHGVLPDIAVIVAHFYDLESGRKDLADRGRGQAHELFEIPIPRDGGIQDLLEEAERPDRRFDVVICEDISRIGRRSYASTEIEHRLEKAGVMLIAADEPFRLDNTGRRAKTSTQVLTRRVKQGVAEWYVIEMLEKSWDGFETHTEQGYNVGKPCYGYRAKKVPHPVPAKRAKGVKKTRLEVHHVEGSVVRKVFGWRVVERLSYEDIADRLNEDLVTNPPPTPIELERAVGYWTGPSVRDVLSNPKHTGHMVWNRRARKGSGRNRVNPVSEWVWSPEPTHEALVDLETFVQAQEVAQRRERSRTASTNRNPQAKRVYRLRSYLYCVGCGRRLYGKTKRRHAYYVCARKRHTGVPEGHPSTYWIPERFLLAGLTTFLADQVFGQYRRQLLDESLHAVEASAQQAREDRMTALRRSIAETETKSKRLVRSLEVAEDVDQAFIRDINERRAELRSQKDDLERQLVQAEDEVRRTPNPTLLDYLPTTSIDLVELPDELSRRLFEALRLEIRYDHNARIATCRVTLLGETIKAVSRSIHAATIIPFLRQKGPAMDKQLDPQPGTVCVVPPAGLEPATKRVGERSCQNLVSLVNKCRGQHLLRMRTAVARGQLPTIGSVFGR